MKPRVKVSLICVAFACCNALSSIAAADLQLVQSSNLFGGDPSGSMRIDIKPGDEANIMYRNAGRVIPVAIMGSSSLDVASINPRTMRLEGIDVMLVGKSDKSLCKVVDIDADGHDDLLCDVRTTGFRVKEGSYTIRLKAETYDKTSLRGTDHLRIIGN